jgi:uncharacterized protein
MIKKIRMVLLTFFVILAISGCAGSKWGKNIGDKDTNLNLAAENVQANAINNIAVMLPLKGKTELAMTGQAIHNGLLAAYYSSNQQAKVNIKVIDTTGGDVNTLYQQAVTEGANVIIGPLTKVEVENIANNDSLSVPTIALNTLDNYQRKSVNNLYQFGLLPQDEAVQVAIKMKQENLKNIAIVMPQNAWGDKVVRVFEGAYASSDWRIVATLKYDFDNDLAGQICNFLAYDATKLCGYQERKNKKQKTPEEEAAPKRRQDIDSIFLVATTAAQARQIVPLLKFYYASDLPIYSISTIYSGTSKPDLDQDINNVYFCDMPWVTKNVENFSPELQKVYNQITMTKMWEHSFVKYKKFYALGVDAYNLAENLSLLPNAQKNGIEGASGVLYLDDFNHIYRELQWVQMQDGVLKNI